ncbi:spore coat associated protein CotJA [Pelotomaculum propionicicum]|uniref:Spore coat associated protein JA (CotJA) n=1 Tax=Pelotomaculum propionicicum TaxID=258475 RepID=A0A4Y7RLI4_9FIRM|nr:spore coat associated protein CotJA [Pelotomaculum propionicicum]NLI11553.1 spore coat associated protein CotJA [Peptococcaceae bacterium]TEB09686.1 hypothetical protein Pmgp_02932 [Pelotomaculum propionicicum]
MFLRASHPFFGRQPVKAERKEDKENRQSSEIKAEAAATEVQAEGIFPQARLAQSYVIWQKYGPIFNPAEALEKGTIFPDLYSPYPF